MKLYVITVDTADYGPGAVIVRLHEEFQGELVAHLEPLAVERNLLQARAAIARVEPTWVRLERHPDDDPVIVESYGSPEDVALCRSFLPVCSRCEGTGRAVNDPQYDAGVDCPKCGGSGRLASLEGRAP